ncbi:hypothetical protein V7201_14755 [Bacillus sp. JJ1122]|uniref:hypothetical protein n=1 Tax=Bacillus sp. JJ1122 TaxID=3122951 RepID=UPI002FFFEDAD
MFNKVLLWGMLILPWFTLFFLKKEGIKRYMPVAIFASLLMTVYNVFAYNQKHWEIKVMIIPLLKPLFVSGLFGGFLIVTIWIFYYTYGHFWKYLTTNIVADFMFAIFPIHYLFQEKLGIYQLHNITPLGRFTLFVLFSLLIYLYQMWQEEVLISK